MLLGQKDNRDFQNVCAVTLNTGLSFGHFSSNHRLVDLQEYRGIFWKFPLSFEKTLEFLDNFLGNIGN